MSYIKFKNVIKEYTMGEITIKALENTNFEIEKGELTVIVGPSGAGKTTALNILGGMDTACLLYTSCGGCSRRHTIYSLLCKEELYQ